MKTKYIFTSLLACAAVLASCQKIEKAVLTNVQVSSSYVAISKDGGVKTITVTANDAWSIDTTGTKKYFQVEPIKGVAGVTEVAFTAPAVTATVEKELKLVCNGESQTIKFLQMTEKQELPVTSIADVIAAGAGNFRICGTVRNIYNLQYGNFYVDDETGSMCIYGTCNKKGATASYPIADWGIEEGDMITVEGPYSLYGTTSELVDVTVVKLVKSLLKVEPTTVSLMKEGGVAEFVAKYKGNDLNVVPDVDWITLGSFKANADSTIVYLQVAENTDENSRTGTVTVTSSIPGQTSSATVTISQAGLIGTEAVPFTVEQAINFCSTLTNKVATTDDYYVKGKISKIVYQYSAQFGTATFWISDDGTFADSKDADFECYSVYWLGNNPWVDGNSGISEGDEVIVCGKLVNFSGTKETSSKAAYVYSINGVKEETGNGVGGKDYPFNIAGAIAYCVALGNGTVSTCDVYVKGLVSKIYSQFSTQYGTSIFWLSDDGTFEGSADGKTTTDKTKNFECYSVYWYNKVSWTEGCGVIAEGDEVVVKGKVTNYSSLGETKSKQAWIYSINGETEEAE